MGPPFAEKFQARRELAPLIFTRGTPNPSDQNSAFPTMTVVARRILLFTVLGATVALTGCAYDQRILQIRTFEAGYFRLLQHAEYDQAYESLHSEIKTLLPLERYRIFFTVLTDTLGPMKAWQPLPTRYDRVPLLEKQRRQDPLPPDHSKTMLEVRYRLIFEKGTVTMDIFTGWDEGRMAIRREFLCCADQQTVAALQARAITLGVGDLFGVTPAPNTQNSSMPEGPVPLEP
jgi:hypothetical protein